MFEMNDKQRTAVADLVAYNFASEERDVVEMGQEGDPRHIFTSIQMLQEWLQANAQDKQEIISEDWLLENLPNRPGDVWTYDCRFEPEPAFLIYAGEGGAAPRYGPFVLPLRLLHNPEATQELTTRLSDHGHKWEQRARRAERTLAEIKELLGNKAAEADPEEELVSPAFRSLSHTELAILSTIRQFNRSGIPELSPGMRASQAELTRKWEDVLTWGISEVSRLADIPVPVFNAHATSLALRNGIQQLENALHYVRSGIPE